LPTKNPRRENLRFAKRVEVFLAGFSGHPEAEVPSARLCLGGLHLRKARMNKK
jgi:hypothetical protein